MRTPPVGPVLLVPLALTAVLGAACGAPDPGTPPAAGPPAMMQASPLAGPLSVYAVPPLTQPYQDVQAKLATSSPALTLTYTFAGPGVLDQQVRRGSPADVLTSTDEAGMRQLAANGLIEAPEAVGRHQDPGGPATYWIAVVSASGNQAAARAFINYLVAGEGHQVLLSRGFQSP